MRRFILTASLLFKNLKVCPKECSVVLFQPLQESSYKSQAGTKKKKLKAYAYGAIVWLHPCYGIFVSKGLFLFCAIDYFLSATLVFPAKMLSMGVFICVSVSLNHNRS